MKIPYGDKIFDINNTYIFRLGKVIGTNTNNNPVFIHEYKETKIQKQRKQIIGCLYTTITANMYENVLQIV